MKKIPLFILILILFNCSSNKINSFNSEIENIEQKFAPDKSIAVLNAQLEKTKGDWIIKGETTSKMAKKAILKNTKSILGNTDFLDSLVVLPHPALGADTLAIVNVSVANLRRNPSVGAELVDQVILGDKLRVLKIKNNRWYFVQTEYGYLGWVTRYSIEQKLVESKWFANSMVNVTALNAYVFSEPTETSDLISDVVINSKLNLVNIGEYWSSVELPDERTGFIQNSEIINISDESTEISVDKLITTAKSMVGVSYLWGGSSSKMNDCSGFTQTIFLANGLQLPRDARQQALIGETVKFDSTFQTVIPGDLLFFGSDRRITHVGMSLGGYDFIQQDGFVMINSFNCNDPNFDEHRRNGLQIIKRVF